MGFLLFFSIDFWVKRIKDWPLFFDSKMKIEGRYSVLNSVKYGFAILYHMQRLGLASGFNLSVATVLAAAGIVFFLKDGKGRIFKALPSSSHNNTVAEKLWMVPGLQNLGNNCFLNVILQALASCSCFRSFIRKRLEGLSEEEMESMPLAVSLNVLLEDLCIPQHGIEVLNPREVMIAINHYNQNFNLTNQQDAEEAFFHILSSLTEELADKYVPNHGSLADAASLANCRIHDPERRATESESQRWQQDVLGPFDGILGSNLSCHSCSIKISLDFQYFHSLHLSLMAGFSVEGCLKHFFAAEQLEHYYCSHCWHVAAIKYLSISDKHEADVGKLKNCSEQESCCCKHLSLLRTLPWSNSYSRTFKQLNIARSPKILCLHLQRVSVNGLEQPIKFQGHISFPLILNMSLFINSGIGLKRSRENLPMGLLTQYSQSNFSYSNHLDMQLDTRRINFAYGQAELPSLVREQRRALCGVLDKTSVQDTRDRDQSSLSDSECCLEINSPNTMTNSQSDDMVGVVVTHEEVMTDQLDDRSIQDPHGQPRISSTGGYSDIRANTLRQSNKKISGTPHLAPADLHMYRLVSVVEHFGGAGSGHYTVYRRVIVNLKDCGPDQLRESASFQWFGISDSQVYRVSEEDVLAADASLLFYEKISEIPTDS